MGIRHLEYFMKNDLPGGFVEVSLLDEIKKFQKDKKEAPIIIFDLMGLMNSFSPGIDKFFGARHWMYAEILDKVFGTFTSAGCELVFFCDGVLQQQKEEVFMSRQNQNKETELKILDLVEQNLSAKEVISEVGSYIFNCTWIPIINDKAEEHGTLIVSTGHECDTEIAKFACNNSRVLAVMADDSDFLIFPGSWRYFSIKHFDEDDFTTREYSRIALREFLQLNDDQLVLLSTLGGNDIIPYERISKFHRNVGGHQAKKKFPGIATYIKEKLTSDRESNIFHIAKFILKDSKYETLCRIGSSFDLYDTNYEERIIHQSPLLEHCIKYHLSVYEILRGKMLTFLGAYSDYRKREVIPYIEIVLPLVRRQVGLVMNHLKPGMGELQFSFIAKMSHEEPYKVHKQVPIYPDMVEVPALLDLLKRDDHPELDNIRFNLLKWMIARDSLQEVDLLSIPKRFLIPVMILVYLKRNNVISIEEADVFLLSFVKNSRDIASEVVYSLPMNKRALILSFVFANLHSIVSLAFEITGLEDMTGQIEFDGVFFHFLYFLFSKGELEMKKLRADCDHLRLYKD